MFLIFQLCKINMTPQSRWKKRASLYIFITRLALHELWQWNNPFWHGAIAIAINLGVVADVGCRGSWAAERTLVSFVYVGEALFCVRHTPASLQDAPEGRMLSSFWTCLSFYFWNATELDHHVSSSSPPEIWIRRNLSLGLWGY